MRWLRRLLAAWHERHDDVVLRAMFDRIPVTTQTIAGRTGLKAATVCTALTRLEHDGKVTSWLVDGSYPRRRWYLKVSGPR